MKRWEILLYGGCVAATCAALAVVWTKFRAETAGPDETVSVVVPRRDLEPGTVIAQSDIRVVGIPPEYLTETTHRARQEAVGRLTRERVLEGEFLRAERLAPPEAGPPPAGMLGRGNRAIHWPEADALARLLRPGDKVDVLVATAGGPCTLHTAASVLTRTKASTLWLEVPASDLPVAALYASQPRILAMRSPRDSAEVTRACPR
ncbi:MAG: hypothetical protein H6737_23315 [Alphaproteobacteria bacterium]|nr:hypothetical protein [Alphaproteobacteria bacterium]